MGNSMLDEVYERVRDTGPERDGWLSNHAPMAAEALVHRGHEDVVHRWLDDYAAFLEERPRGIRPISAGEWQDPLGDPARTGDWLTFFDREMAGDPWRVVLARWWPRLLPGIAAGATHGVIRTGHAVRALLDDETGPRLTELGQGLAYWAARWQPLAPPGAGPYQRRDPRTALDSVPRVPDQRFGIRDRLAQLPALSAWPAAAGAVPGEPGAEATTRLAGIVDAAVRQHGTHGHGSPIMLVHAATAPNAVLRTLPALPAGLWEPSIAAAWAATAAVTSAYAPSKGLPVQPHLPAGSIEEVMDRAVASGDAHAIKFADTALDTYARGGDPALTGSVAHSIALIAAD